MRFFRRWLQFTLFELLCAVTVAAGFLAVARVLDWGESVFTDVVVLTAAAIGFHVWDIWRTAKDEGLL